MILSWRSTRSDPAPCYGRHLASVTRSFDAVYIRVSEECYVSHDRTRRQTGRLRRHKPGYRQNTECTRWLRYSPNQLSQYHCSSTSRVSLTSLALCVQVFCYCCPSLCSLWKITNMFLHVNTEELLRLAGLISSLEILIPWSVQKDTSKNSFSFSGIRGFILRNHVIDFSNDENLHLHIKKDLGTAWKWNPGF